MTPFLHRSLFLSLFLTSTSLLASGISDRCNEPISQYSSEHPPLYDIPRPLPEKISSYELEGRAATHMPEFFEGFSGYNPDVVLRIRDHFSSKSWDKPKSIDALTTEHCDALVPFVTSLQQSFPQEMTTSQLKLSKEISQHLKQQKVNLLWACTLPWRLVSLENTHAYPEELNLFDHTVSPAFMRGLTQGGAWKSQFDFFLSIGQSSLQNDVVLDHPLDLQNTHYAFSDTVEDCLRNHFLQTPYPMWGHDRMGISFLVNRITEGIFPIGFPSRDFENIKAHGAPLSRLGFAVHDFLHQEVHPIFDTFLEAVIRGFDRHFEKGGDVASFAPVYIPHALNSYHTLTQTWQTLHQLFLTKLIPLEGKAAYERVMAGWFITAHEYPSGHSSFYSTKDFVALIQEMTKNTSQALFDEDSWESPEDPLQTSPLDGRSALTEREILEHVFAQWRNEPENSPEFFMPAEYYKLNYPFPDRVTYLKGLITGFSITQSPRFIDVAVKFRTGQEKLNSFSTLFHKWQNMEDSLSLLGAGGIKFEVPDLSSAKNPRETAIDMLTTVREELGRMVTDFQDTATRYANIPYKNRHSLADSFFSKRMKAANKLDKKERKILDHSKKQQEEISKMFNA